MPLPQSFDGRLALPAIAAPMYLVSGPELVVAACQAGVVGAFPALNRRTSEGFEAWLEEIGGALEDARRPDGMPAAPFGVNLIVHKTNPRLKADLKLCVEHKVPLVITSLGAANEVFDAVHGYGGVVFHDITNMRHAEKAATAGADGLILVCAGAGGHAGTFNPFALLPEVRRLFAGTIVLAGCISGGRAIAAAQMMGADLAYLGTRFIATKESLADDGFKRMILDSAAADIVYTPVVSGIPGSFLRQSLIDAGLDSDDAPGPGKMDFGARLKEETKAWKHVWSAGQGVGSIDDVPAVADLVARFRGEYQTAVGDRVGRAGTQAAE